MRGYRRCGLLSVLSFLLSFTGLRVGAELQFDVFVGYDGWVREASWFPVAFEVNNDGPTFTGVIELSSGQLGTRQARRVTVELPTNTRKRIVIPAFASAGRYASWDARLLDGRGRVRSERTGIQAKDVVWEGVLLGAISRSQAGLPVLPPLTLQPRKTERHPQVARIPVELVPDNPIALEGLSAVYLNSERAIELRPGQAQALVSWVRLGGHLILSTEQPGDVNATPWLKGLAPMELTGVTKVQAGLDLVRWVRNPTAVRGGVFSPNAVPTAVALPGRASKNPMAANRADPFESLPDDGALAAADMAVATGRVVDGTVLLSAAGSPLVVQAERGRGMVTLLTFSPEREPFLSWKQKGWFWARLLRVPAAWYSVADFNVFGGNSTDGIFGAMIDSRQIRKLPVEWLLAILIVYLVVIGPLEHWWLKKINKQIWTWVTFPTEVALFTLLIYFIGFKLRHGEAEWNELHVVDVMPGQSRAEMRGRTYLSMYSPVNARYPVQAAMPMATLRGEFQGAFRVGQETSSATVEQRPEGFQADLFVPVWTSQLFVSDWYRSGEVPIEGRLTQSGGVLRVEVRNRLTRPLTYLRLAYQGRIYELGNLPAQQTTTFPLEPAKGRTLPDFVMGTAQQFQGLVQRRQQTFGGGNAPAYFDDLPRGAAVASFIGQMDRQIYAARNFVHPPGLDLSELIEGGQAVLLAWDSGQSLIPALNAFDVKRGQRNTLLRLALAPVASATP